MRKFLSGSFISVLLILSLAFYCSCSKNTDAENDDKSADNIDAEENSAAETTTERLTADLPDIDMKGRDFTVLCCTHPFENYVQRDIFAQEENGDIINDAVYRRNRIVEARLNCVINEYVVPYGGVSAEVSKRVKAGDSGIDAAAVYLNQFGTLATQNMLIEYGNLPHIDLDKPWWDKNSVESLSISNKLFATCSDFLVYDKRMTMTIVFNKKIIADYGLEDIYTLIKNGEWTLDKMREMTKGIAADLDGNGKYDDNDRYGVITSNDSFICFINGGDEYIAKKDENDRPYITLNSDKAIDVIDDICDFLFEPSNCLNAQTYAPRSSWDSYTGGMALMFEEEKALFANVFMNDVESLRGMDADFGIIPPPKYSKEQRQYYSNVNPYVATAIIVPQTCPSPEESSAALEALSCEGKYLLQPAYYDVCLNTKIARDEESSEMLDIIFQNRVYDVGNIYNFAGISDKLNTMAAGNNRNFTSMYEKSENVTQQAIDKIVSSFEEIN